MKVTIGFSYNDEQTENYYSAESTMDIDPQYFDVIDELGEQFNTFLKQVGYVRNNDYIFMEDVNEDEYAALAQFLDDYRANRKATPDPQACKRCILTHCPQSPSGE